MFEKPEPTNVRRISCLVLFLTIYICSFANSRVQTKPKPAWLIPAKQQILRPVDLKNVSGGFYFDLMDRQVNLVNQTIYYHFIRHIVNESGVQDASEVSVNFAPLFQQLEFHKVLIIRSGKAINQLHSSSVKLVDEETDASDFEYNGIKRAYLILKDVQKGDLVDVSYSIIGFNPVFGGHYSGDFSFSGATPVSNYYLTLITEPGRKYTLCTLP